MHCIFTLEKITDFECLMKTKLYFSLVLVMFTKTKLTFDQFQSLEIYFWLVLVSFSWEKGRQQTFVLLVLVDQIKTDQQYLEINYKTYGDS